MPMQLSEDNGGRILVVHVSGRLKKADYEQLVAEFERLAHEVDRDGALERLEDDDALFAAAREMKISPRARPPMTQADA